MWYDYIIDTPLVANVIAFVLLGIIGVLVRSVIKATGDIVIGQSDIKQAQSEYEQRGILARMILVNGRLYKNAVLASNLKTDGKLQTMVDYAELEVLFSQFENLKVAVPEPINEAITTTNVMTSGFIQTAVKEGSEFIKDKGEDMLSTLRNEIKNIDLVEKIEDIKL